ncbi:hypothetical protein M0638_28175, partial [Roseomonas sp. NAR14]
MNHQRPIPERIDAAVNLARLDDTARLHLELMRDDNRRVLPALSNALLILALDPILAGIVGRDDFKAEFVLRF